MRQDLTVSPFVHQEWSPLNVRLVYERSNKLEQQASLKFGHYSPRIGEAYSYNSFYNGEQTTLPHDFTMIDINYALGFSVMENGKWKFALGGKSKNKFYASTYNFGPSGPSPLFIAFGLDIWLNMQYDIMKNTILNLTYPCPSSHIFTATPTSPRMTSFSRIYILIMV